MYLGPPGLVILRIVSFVVCLYYYELHETLNEKDNYLD